MRRIIHVLTIATMGAVVSVAANATSVDSKLGQTAVETATPVEQVAARKRVVVRSAVVARRPVTYAAVNNCWWRPRRCC